jgi:transmembrane sensor
VFSVARSDVATEVWTQDGALGVVWQGEPITLPPNTHRVFEDAPILAPEPEPEPESTPDAREPPRERPTADWRTPARDGDYHGAYRQLRRARSLGTSVADLMLAADVFRLSGHAEEAVAPLERVVAKHRSDPRAPLASFTLGRVLLDELGRPAAAARAFAAARALAPKGALAEDALAREVEAWAKAGNASSARQRAELYLEFYPVGHRQRAVEQYGGL